MPSRANIDPAEMRPYLSLVMLIDVVRDPRRFVYRLVGTMETEMRGRDPTGLSVSEASSGNPQDAVAFYEMITNNRLPALYVGEYTPRPDRLIREQIIGLPLSDDGKSVNMILVFSVVEWLKEANADK